MPIVQVMCSLTLQGDHSGCVKPTVDLKTKVAILVHGPHTKTQLLFKYQQGVWQNLNGHPVVET